MNHTTKTLAIVGMLAIAAALIGAVAVSVLLPAAHAQSYTSNDNSKDPGKKNSIDIENSQTNFSFKQKLKNNCSGFATCTNDATESLAP
jgi:hypothetical protein